MQPFLSYNRAFLMDDGTKPDLTVNKQYPLDCSFMSDGVLNVSVINDKNKVHTFDTGDDWFSEHFSIHGDVDLVMEEI